MTEPRIFQAYAAYEVHDEYGRSKQCIGYYESDVSAKDVAMGRGWYGGPGDTAKAWLLEVGGSVYVLASKETIKLNQRIATAAERRAEILEKLTPEERNILGVW